MWIATMALDVPGIPGGSPPPTRLKWFCAFNTKSGLVIYGSDKLVSIRHQQWVRRQTQLKSSFAKT
jgi:hypothetical protein